MVNTMNRAVFLDRDGVVNGDASDYYVKNVADFNILSGVPAAIKTLNDRGYRVVLATNQGGIAKGLLTPRVLEDIHRKMNEELLAEGAHIDGIYYCPHHPEGTVKPYAGSCRCRKPGTGMVEKAAEDMDIDLSKSFFVGDKLTDIAAGERVGLTTILVKTGCAGRDGRVAAVPDFVADDLISAVAYIS